MMINKELLDRSATALRLWWPQLSVLSACQIVSTAALSVVLSCQCGGKRNMTAPCHTRRMAVLWAACTASCGGAPNNAITGTAARALLVEGTAGAGAAPPPPAEVPIDFVPADFTCTMRVAGLNPSPENPSEVRTEMEWGEFCHSCALRSITWLCVRVCVCVCVCVCVHHWSTSHSLDHALCARRLPHPTVPRMGSKGKRNDRVCVGKALHVHSQRYRCTVGEGVS
jgi:hypothetical protein